MKARRFRPSPSRRPGWALALPAVAFLCWLAAMSPGGAQAQDDVSDCLNQAQTEYGNCVQRVSQELVDCQNQAYQRCQRAERQGRGCDYEALNQAYQQCHLDYDADAEACNNLFMEDIIACNSDGSDHIDPIRP